MACVACSLVGVAGARRWRALGIYRGRSSVPCRSIARSRCATPAATSKLSLLKRAARANRDQAAALLVKNVSLEVLPRLVTREWLFSWAETGPLFAAPPAQPLRDQLSLAADLTKLRVVGERRASECSTQRCKTGGVLCHLNPAGAPAGATASLPSRRSSRRTPVEETTWTATSRPARQSLSRPAAMAPHAASTSSASSRSGL